MSVEDGKIENFYKSPFFQSFPLKKRLAIRIGRFYHNKLKPQPLWVLIGKFKYGWRYDGTLPDNE